MMNSHSNFSAIFGRKCRIYLISSLQTVLGNKLLCNKCIRKKTGNRNQRERAVYMWTLKNQAVSDNQISWLVIVICQHRIYDVSCNVCFRNDMAWQSPRKQSPYYFLLWKPIYTLSYLGRFKTCNLNNCVLTAFCSRKFQEMPFC